MMAERVPGYDEFRVRIERAPKEGKYRVLASGPGKSSASATFELPFEPTQLENFVLRVVGRTRSGVRSFRSPQMQEAKRFGSELFDAVFRGEVRDLYVAARRGAEEHGRGLRVSLGLSGAPELMEIPWELLYTRPSFLAQSIDTPVVRSLDVGSVRPPRPLASPLRVLGMISSPRGFESLDVDQERSKLTEALSVLVAAGIVELDWLPRATLSELDRALDSREDLHVFHYVGHGAYDDRTEGGVLVLEDDDGGPHEVTGGDLGVLLHDSNLRLAVLNACEGARSSRVDPFSGVASGLVEHGIPAVIAMQFEITDAAAILFADRFYNSVARGYPVDAALAQARKKIWAADSHDVEWATPVLFLGAADARLFDLETVLPPSDQAKLSLQLQPAPADPTVGDAVDWQLTITNAGPHQLTELTAKDPDGRTLAEPVDLAPGQHTTVGWAETVQADHDLVVTVTATEPTGTQLTEQITTHLAARSRDDGRRVRAIPIGLGVLLAAVVFAVVAALVISDPDPTPAPKPSPTQTPRPQPEVGDSITVSGPADGVAVARAVWVATNPEGGESGSIVRVDPKRLTATDTIPLGIGALDSVAVSGGFVWVTSEDGQLGRIGENSARAEDPIPIEGGGELRGLTVAGGFVWVANCGRGTVVRISLEPPFTQRFYEVGGKPRSVAVDDDGRVYAAVRKEYNACKPGPSGTRRDRIAVLDTGSDNFRTLVEIEDPTAVVLATDAARKQWLLVTETPGEARHRVLQVDPETGAVEGTVQVDPGLSSLAADSDGVWALSRVSGGNTAKVTRIELRNGIMARAGKSIPVDGDPQEIAVGAGRVWLTQNAGAVTPITP